MEWRAVVIADSPLPPVLHLPLHVTALRVTAWRCVILLHRAQELPKLPKIWKDACAPVMLATPHCRPPTPPRLPLSHWDPAHHPVGSLMFRLAHPHGMGGSSSHEALLSLRVIRPLPTLRRRVYLLARLTICTKMRQASRAWQLPSTVDHAKYRPYTCGHPLGRM